MRCQKEHKKQNEFAAISVDFLCLQSLLPLRAAASQFSVTQLCRAIRCDREPGVCFWAFPQRRHVAAAVATAAVKHLLRVMAFLELPDGHSRKLLMRCRKNKPGNMCFSFHLLSFSHLCFADFYVFFFVILFAVQCYYYSFKLYHFSRLQPLRPCNFVIVVCFQLPFWFRYARLERRVHALEFVTDCLVRKTRVFSHPPPPLS